MEWDGPGSEERIVWIGGSYIEARTNAADLAPDRALLDFVGQFAQGGRA
jgi:hypothetical protein